MAPRSNIWKYFTKETGAAKCQICSNLVKTAGNTANLWQHLERYHFARYKSLKTDGKTVTDKTSDTDAECLTPTCLPTTQNKIKKNLTIAESLHRAAAFSDSGHKTAELNEALVYMIAKDNMPLRTVERSGFAGFCKVAVPLFKLPSRRTLTRMIDDKFFVLKEAVKEKISTVALYSLTSDVWTDSGNNKSFLGMTLHYLDDLKICSIAIDVKPLDSAHTAQYLASVISEICDDWGIINGKVNVMVTDGGANIVAAMRQIFSEAHHTICVDHSVNRVTTVAIELSPGFNEILSKIRNVVYFKRSVKACDDLRAMQIREGKSEGEVLKLKKDEPTRWNSNFEMLNRFLQLKEYISVITLRHPNVIMLTAAEIEVAKEGRDMLHFVSHVITELESESTSLAGKVIPILKILRRKIENLPVNSEQVKQLKKSFLNQFDRKFQKIDFVENFAIATLIDPRFKTIYFEPLSHANAIRLVSEKIFSAEKEDQLQIQTQPIHPRNTDGSGLWEIHEELVSQSNASMEPDRPGGVAGELRHFLHQPVTDRATDPFLTWESIKSEYPNLYRLACDYLSRMVTSVPSERLFSRTGETCQNRFRLNPTRMARLTLISSLPDEFWNK